MTTPVACDAPDRLAAVPLLEDEHDDAERAAERDEVEDHGLQRQHDRAERASEQDEREQDHEGEDVREVAVDRVDEVALLGGGAAERDRHAGARLGLPRPAARAPGCR